MKTILYKRIFTVVVLFICGCSCHSKKQTAITAESLITIKNNRASLNQLAFNFSVAAADTLFTMPALQSFASGNYNGLWVFIGGKKSGFHGTSSYNPFPSTKANDSIWVVDPVAKKSWGVPVPVLYQNYLIATNAATVQTGSSLFMCGGFTRDTISAPQFNTTSNHLFEFNLPALIQYVKSGGTTPALSQVIVKVIASPYLQVSGGNLFKVNDNFYLIGGQNYNSAYSSGKTGIYTNAVRKFKIQNTNNIFSISDTVSVTDTANLHRRDMNVVPYFNNGNISAIIYGGVFTKQDVSFNHPVTISGLNGGLPSILVDSMLQKVNQYSCAKANIYFEKSNLVISALFGGISYMRYDTVTQKLVIGDDGIMMPFSNLISINIKYGQFSPFEYVQLPPNDPELPAYMGANAAFFPLPQYTLNGSPEFLNGNKVFSSLASGPVLIGYIYGGIISLGPTSGTTPNGPVATYANPVLYKVYINPKTLQ